MNARSDPVRDIVRATLYEGYVLWPYRPAPIKNPRRGTLGGIHPRAWHDEGHADDRCMMRAQTLVRAPEDGVATVEVTFRCLQIVKRRIAARQGPRTEFLDQALVDGQQYVPGDEAIERQVTLPRLSLSDGARETTTIAVRPGTSSEPIETVDGQCPIRLARYWRSLTGTAIATAKVVSPSVFRISVDIHNDTGWTGGTREDALRSSFNSAHIVLHTRRGVFISVSDPPEALLAAAQSCENEGCWPVLVGERGDTDTVLAAPIFLADYPVIAPESPGNRFDCCKIDELLVLNALGLSNEEKARMRAADPRLHEISKRTESLTPEQMLGVPGTFRSLK